MIGQTISHYSAFWNPAVECNPRKRDKILEKSRPELYSGRGCSVVRGTNDENARSGESDRHSFRSAIGTALGEGGMFENHPRTFCVSGCDFQNPCLRAYGHFGRQAPKQSVGGGVA